jgi:hypothetical protein
MSSPLALFAPLDRDLWGQGKKVHVLRFSLAQISTERNIVLLPVVCAGTGVESGFRELCSNGSRKVHHRSVEC